MKIKPGQKIGRWKIIKFIGRIPTRCKGTLYWLCKCSCGTKRPVPQKGLRNGKSTSCGCYAIEKMTKAKTKHGRCGTIEYGIWAAMIQRCYNKNNKAYPRYGGRGIKVCKRWRNSFATFFKDTGIKPFANASLDRINNDGNYCPHNIRWATPKQQVHNSRTVHFITIDKQTHILTDWLKVKNMSLTKYYSGLKSGLSPEEALTAPFLRPKHPITINGQTKLFAQWCKYFGLNRTSINWQAKKTGQTIEYILLSLISHHKLSARSDNSLSKTNKAST